MYLKGRDYHIGWMGSKPQLHAVYKKFISCVKTQDRLKVKDGKDVPYKQ